MVLDDERLFRDACHLTCDTHNIQHLWLYEAVVDVLAIPPGSDDLLFAQGHQLLGNVCLPQPEQRLEMTHTGLTRSDSKQDLHAYRVTDGGQQVADFLVRFDWFAHIPKLECIIRTYSEFGM